MKGCKIENKNNGGEGKERKSGLKRSVVGVEEEPTNKSDSEGTP